MARWQPDAVVEPLGFPTERVAVIRAVCNNCPVEYEALTAEERAWVVRNERVWSRAYEIVARHPNLDVSGVYHTLLQLERTPEERLRRSLALGRGFARAARQVR